MDEETNINLYWQTSIIEYRGLNFPIHRLNQYNTEFWFPGAPGILISVEMHNFLSLYGFQKMLTNAKNIKKCHRTDILLRVIRIHLRILYKIKSYLHLQLKIPWLTKHRVFTTPATIRNSTATSLHIVYLKF